MLGRLLRRRPSPALVISLITLFIVLGGTAYAANGNAWILGFPNNATAVTALTSNNAGKAVNITQQSAGTGATALGLNVPSGKTPFTVNSGVKVANLNADKLDGLHSTSFVPIELPASMAAHGSCTADDGVETNCGSGIIALGRAGKVMATATGAWHTFALDDAIGPNAGSDNPNLVRGLCGLRVDGTPIGFSVGMGEFSATASASHPSGEPGSFALTGRTNSIAAGNHTVEVDCTEVDGDIDWDLINLTAAVVDDDVPAAAASAPAPAPAGASDTSYAK